MTKGEMRLALQNLAPDERVNRIAEWIALTDDVTAIDLQEIYTLGWITPMDLQVLKDLKKKRYQEISAHASTVTTTIEPYTDLSNNLDWLTDMAPPLEDIPIKYAFLLFGKPGAGKTCLAGSAMNIPEMRPALMLVAEAGHEALRKVAIPGDKSFRVRNIKCFDELRQVREQLLAHPGEIKTVIIDNLSEFGDMLQNEMLQERYKKKFEWDDWSDYRTTMLQFIRAWRDMEGLTTFFVAWDKYKQQKYESAINVVPDIPGSACDKIPGLLSFSFHMEIMNGERYIICDAEGDDVPGKDRLHMLPSPLKLWPFGKGGRYGFGLIYGILNGLFDENTPVEDALKILGINNPQFLPARRRASTEEDF